MSDPLFAPVAIVGRGCVLPGALAPEELWRIAVGDERRIAPVPADRWGLDPDRVRVGAAHGASSEGIVSTNGGIVTGFDERFDPSGFALPTETIAGADTLTRYLLHAGRAALREAGRAERPDAFRRGGAIVGNLGYPTAELSAFAEAVWDGRPLPAARHRFATGLPAQVLCDALALGGDGFALDAACASSLYAIAYACDRLHDGHVDYMLAGGVNAIDNITLFYGFTALGALSASGRSRPFDREADGLVPAEGAALVVLKLLDRAIADGDPIFGVIRGIGLANDGRGKGLLVPSAAGQRRAIEEAYRVAGLRPSDVSYLECHATGTLRGDAVELESTGAVFAGLRDVAIGSLKANLGHLVTASGAAGLIKVLEAMGARTIPPVRVASPTAALADGPFRLPSAAEPWESAGPRVAAISSFGFGGNNAHLLVEEWDGGAGRTFASVVAPPAEPPAIAIVALAAQVADGSDLAAFREHLYAGRTRGDDDGARMGAIVVELGSLRITPDDLQQALPQQVLAVKVALDAARAVRVLPNERTSVFVGAPCDPNASRLTRRIRRYAAGIPTPDSAVGIARVDAASILGAMPNMPANRVNAQLDLRGPSCTVFGEELSGLDALALARRALERGRIDAAIVAAADLACEPVHALAAAAVLAFSFHRPGDGAVAFVLKRAADARRDGEQILAVLAPDGAAAASFTAASERTRATFGHVHGAAALIDVAAAVLALRDRVALPSTAGDGTALAPSFAAEPRRFRLETTSFTGRTGGITLAAADAAAEPVLREPPYTLALYRGETAAALVAAVAADRREPPVATVAADGGFRLALAAPIAEFDARRAAALRALRDPAVSLPPGAYLGTGAPAGELALVFTGAASGYAGMGAALLLAFPQVRAEVTARFAGLEDLGLTTWAYGARTRRVGDLERLAGTTLLAQFHARFLRGLLGLAPDAAIGMSSGETNALFAFDAWTGMGPFFASVRDSGMYDRALGGAHEIVRAEYAARGIAFDGWATWRIAADAAAVAAVIGDDRAVEIAIVDAPQSLVLSGERAACDRVVAAFPGRAVPLEMDLACHVRAIDAYAPAWHALHDRPTTPPSGVRFYANATNASYFPTREAVADALTAQAVAPIDFPRTIRQAYADGVRTFVECGPRDHCTQAIDATLGALPHHALALDVLGVSAYERVFHVAAALLAEGRALDARTLAEPASVAPRRAPEVHAMTVSAHLPAVVPAAEDAVLVPRAPALALAPIAPALDRARLVDHGPPGLRVSRAGLETLAGGRISEVFGPWFARQDGYDVQVRMPEPPLLLADRVTGLVGVPGRMGLASVYTETDVVPDAWWVSGGRMPMSVVIESGQADLLGISWVGIDFIVQGERAYRLLGCKLTFRGGLPRVGETVCYDIHIDGHANAGATRLFFFHYDCRIAGGVRLEVRGGQAGLFSPEELENSQGVLWTPEDAGAAPARELPHDPPRALPAARAFGAEAMAAFHAGDLYAFFGAGFERAASHTRTPQMPMADPRLLGEIAAFDPQGGPWGRGYMRVERAVAPEDWFFAGHFKNDPVMPGTLLLDVAFGTLALYMSAIGATLDRDGWRFEPVPDETFALQCRGQILPTSRRIVGELYVHAFAAGPYPTLTVDFLGSVDGKKAFHARKIALRLVPDFPLAALPAGGATDILGERAMLACASGDPRDAFGSAFTARYPAWRPVQRLPQPPLLLISRLRDLVEGTGANGVGTAVTAELDLTGDEWYFRENGNAAMPFVALLEAALQPCGWLTSFVGATLPIDAILKLRNLDGSGVVHAEVPARPGKLTTRAVLRSFSRVGSIALTEFGVETHLGGTLVFSGTTTFGVFIEEMLADQAGLASTQAERAAFAAPANVAIDLRSRPEAYFGTPRLAEGTLLMLDRLTGMWADGGTAGLGLARAELDVDPYAWMFKAHFLGDPVQPGSLGIEALVQLLQAAVLAKELHAGMRAPRFETLATGEPVTWKYRGQVVPANGRVTTVVDVTAIEHDAEAICVRASGALFVDGKLIYRVPALAVRLTDAARDGAEERVELAREPWLRDHAPTQVIPVLPMVDVVDRFATAVLAVAPGARVVEIADVVLAGWIPVTDEEPLRLRTRVTAGDDGAYAVVIDAWRTARTAALSGFREAARGVVRIAAAYDEPPVALEPLAGAIVHDGTGTPGRDLYLDGTLFHGPALDVVRHATMGEAGSSALVDADPGPVGLRTLNPRLLDGIIQAMPWTDFALWTGRSTAGNAGFPSRIDALRVYGPTPASGTLRSEIRYRGTADEHGRFLRTETQAITPDGRVWCTIAMTVVLFPARRVLALDGATRRAWLRGERAVPNVLTERDGDVTRIADADAREADYLRGTLARVYGVPRGDATRIAGAVAAKEHAARAFGIHPRDVEIDAGGTEARSALRPYRVLPLARERTGDGWAVRDAGPTFRDLTPLRETFARAGYDSEMPLAHVVAALAHTFVDDFTIADRATASLLRERPILFVANHQVVIESPLARALLAPFVGGGIEVMARDRLRPFWVGEWAALLASYPGCAVTELTRWVTHDPRSIFDALEAFRAELRQGPRSLFVHADGRYAVSCAHGVRRVSATLLDLAIAEGMPVVPVRFVGALPVEPAPRPFEFPVGLGRLSIAVGAAIDPAELAALPLKERTARVRAAIDAAGPEPAHEVPHPPNPELEARVAERQARGASRFSAVLAEAVAAYDPRDGFDMAPIRRILAEESDPRPAYAAWNARFRDWFLHTPEGLADILSGQPTQAQGEVPRAQ